MRMWVKKGAKHKNRSNDVHAHSLVRASRCISRKIWSCKMKALAFTACDCKLFIVVSVARYTVTLVSFFRVSTQNCFCLACAKQEQSLPWRQVVHCEQPTSSEV